MSELATLSNTSTQPDPLALIDASGKAERTKVEYKRVLAPFLCKNALTDTQALATYARSLPASRRTMLRAAVKLWVDEATTRMKQAQDPTTMTADRRAKLETLYDTLETLPETIQAPKAKPSKPHIWLSGAQVEALAQTCDKTTTEGLRDAVVLGLLVGAALRRAELAALEWGSVVRKPIEDRMRTVIVVQGKGDKTREIPISEALAAILDTWGTVAGKEGRIARSVGQLGDIGESLSTTAIFEIVRDHGASIGMPELAPHDLRRTFAELGYRKTGDIVMISTLLGHASIETTMRYLDLKTDLEVTASDFVPWS